MRFLVMGLAFAAIGFLVVNSLCSALTVALWRNVRASRRRSGSLFLLRMLPAIASTGLVLGLVLPAYGLFEPRNTGERLGPALFGFIVVAGALVGGGLYRAAVSWWKTRRLERAWRAAAVESVRLGLPVRAYRVPSDLPLAALVGVIRPRLFVSDRFLDSLSADERKAVLDHEAGHLLSLDNLKRTLMRLAPDWLSFSRTGREIEAAWAIAAEEEADDHAAGPDRRRSIELAGALLKAVRLTPAPFAPASNFYDGATVARRVARLLDDRSEPRDPARRGGLRFALFAGLAGGTGLLAGPALRAAYTLTEAAVKLLTF